jgi:DNA-binding NarL/FixJ family response regulator
VASAGTSNTSNDKTGLFTVVLAIGSTEATDAWANTLRERSDVVCHASSRSDVSIRELCGKMSPCVLIIDEMTYEQQLAQHSENGIAWPQGVHVVVRCSDLDDEREARLLREGCDGTLNASAEPNLVAKAVECVTEGELWASRRTISALFKNLRVGVGPQPTPREAEVWRYIGMGYKNREIAEVLFISIPTVRWHIRGLCRRLGVRGRAQVAERWKAGKGGRSPSVPVQVQ